MTIVNEKGQDLYEALGVKLSDVQLAKSRCTAALSSVILTKLIGKRTKQRWKLIVIDGEESTTVEGDSLPSALEALASQLMVGGNVT